MSFIVFKLGFASFSCEWDKYFEKYNIFYKLFSDELHDLVPWLGLLCT